MLAHASGINVQDTRTPSCTQVLNGTLGSPNCGTVLAMNATTYRLEVYYAKAVNYTLMITTLSFLQARAPSGLQMQLQGSVLWPCDVVSSQLHLPGRWCT